eukprot:5091630-Amphidinium_carterae.1
MALLFTRLINFKGGGTCGCQKDATLVTTFPHGTVFHASGRAGHFLRVCIEDDDGRTLTLYMFMTLRC